MMINSNTLDKIIMIMTATYQIGPQCAFDGTNLSKRERECTSKSDFKSYLMTWLLSNLYNKFKIT